ncbi:MAG TPA: mismatch repair protein [Terriglobales bacterium]|nr:mismatch repair protein [Terriglobales bacterium]
MPYRSPVSVTVVCILAARKKFAVPDVQLVTPTEEYTQRLISRESRAAQLDKIHLRLGNVRLVLVVVAGLMAYLSLGRQLYSPWWIAAPLAIFFGIAVYHSRVLEQLACANRASSYYRDGLARIADQWLDLGDSGERFVNPHHVYASDLDLFGKGSLFQLLSTARTRMGQETLAGWLLAPAPTRTILDRQAAIRDLRDRTDLREELALLGEAARIGVHSEKLIEWAEAPNRLRTRWFRWLAPAFALLAIVGAILWAMQGTGWPFLLIVIVEAAITFRLRKHLELILHGTEKALGDLDLLSSVLDLLERETFGASLLQTLSGDLCSHTVPGSGVIARLRSIVHYIEAQHNSVVRALDIPLLYSVQVAYAAEAWREQHGRAVRGWLQTVGAFEALLSLATYHYEHPGDPFPEFGEGNPSFSARQLGHPLLPAATCVRNDVSVGGETRVLLVSGSNMSGKSTLLRAIGINVVLAMAGAPVRADGFRLTPLQVGASIRINDSLQEGSSRFYAEITRLRQIFDLAQSAPPLMFLLDELLQGTNSTDRRIGAEGLVRALLERRAIGVISTHDLALTQIGGEHQGQIHNVHFQDELRDGKIRFDYQLREGVVAKSNGLELMRSIGLQV